MPEESPETPPHVITEYAATPVARHVTQATDRIKWCLSYLHDVQEMSPQSALDGLAAAKKLRRYANALENTFATAAEAEMLQGGVAAHEGDGYTAVLHTDSNRKDWRTDSLVNEVADRHLAVTKKTYPDIPASAQRRLILGSMAQLAKAGRIEWRSTALRDMGIDPDEFSRKDRGTRASIEMRGQATYTDPTNQAVGPS